MKKSKEGAGKMSECAAGIVTYNPNMKRLIENVNAILPQVEQVILVDNGSANINERAV